MNAGGFGTFGSPCNEIDIDFLKLTEINNFFYLLKRVSTRPQISFHLQILLIKVKLLTILSMIIHILLSIFNYILNKIL